MTDIKMCKLGVAVYAYLALKSGSPIFDMTKVCVPLLHVVTCCYMLLHVVTCCHMLLHVVTLFLNHSHYPYIFVDTIRVFNFFLWNSRWMDRDHSHHHDLSRDFWLFSKDMLGTCIPSQESPVPRFQIFTALQCFLFFGLHGLQDLSVAQLLAMRQLVSKLQPYLLQKASSKDREGGAAGKIGMDEDKAWL